MHWLHNNAMDSVLHYPLTMTSDTLGRAKAQLNGIWLHNNDWKKISEDSSHILMIDHRT